MTVEQSLIVAILVAVMIGFVWGRLRYDVVALLGLCAALLAELVPAAEAFDGFGHPATITVAAVLVVSRGLANSGAVDLLARLAAPAARAPSLHVGALGSIGAAASAVMNNVAALALLMPVAVQSAAKSKHSAAVVLMPLSFATILGGLVTLIGTPPNVIVAAFREGAQGEPFGMFDFAPVGLAVAAVGMVYLSLVGWRLLPRARRSKGDSEGLFDLEDYVAEVTVPEDSTAIGKSVREVEEETPDSDVTVIGLFRQGRRMYAAAGRETVRSGDVLIVETGPEGLDKFVSKFGLEVAGSDRRSERPLETKDVTLVEAVVTARSSVIGRTAGDLNLRYRHGVNLLAISRQGQPIRERVRRARLRAGDVLLLQGEADRFPDTIAALGALPLAERKLQFGRRSRTWLCVGIFAAAIAAAVSGLLPLVVALTVAVVTLVVLDIVPPRELYGAVDWPVVVLLGAMLPLGGAMETTGTTELIADSLLAAGGGSSPVLVLVLLLIVTMTLSDVMNNAATTVVAAPIAVTLANRLGVDADPFLMAVAIGASCAFLTPIGHQNNTLVLGPGGYRFSDFWRMGLPLEIIVVAVSVPMILWVWPL